MKTYKKNNITIKELDDGTIRHYDENNNLIYIYIKYPNENEYRAEYDENNNLIYKKWPNENEYRAEYDENNNCIYRKCSDGKESFYINNEKVTKEQWIDHYINNNFHHRYIYDIIETLKDNKQNVNIENIKKHLNNIEINNLEIKYEKVLKYYKIISK